MIFGKDRKNWGKDGKREGIKGENGLEGFRIVQDGIGESWSYGEIFPIFFKDMDHFSFKCQVALQIDILEGYEKYL
jgi:hypothetical protein